MKISETKKKTKTNDDDKKATKENKSNLQAV